EGQRQAYYNHAISEIRFNHAQQQQDLGMARNAFNELKDRQVRGEYISSDEINQARNTFEKLNNPAGVLAVDNFFKHADLHNDFGKQPLADQNQQHHALVAASVARDLYTGLVRRGYSEAQAAGIVGNLSVESTLRPTAFNPAGGGQGAVGLAQWRGERLQRLKDFAASQGRGWQDPELQLDFIDRELRSTESVAGGLLRATTTPEEAARVFSQAYERGEGFDVGRRIAAARSIYDGKSVDGSGGPGARSWEIANQDATIKTTATKLLADVGKDFANGEINYSRRKDLMDIADAARETNNIDLGVKAERLANVMDYVERVRTMPLDQQVGLETEIKRQMAAGTAFDG
ncbi:MAG TPA: phage tail tip lysozyme, partial [Pirellulales bacterium]|nr:phage tail tip lysozyme [Pirellulales bacterium]